MVEGLSLALPIDKVERVIPAVDVTGLPGAPEAVLGVINISGEVIPVFDLRRRFNLPEKEILPENKMIIAAASKRTVAMVADDVRAVISAGPDLVADSGQVLPRMSHIKGVLKTGEGMLIIQDIDSFLSIEEQEALSCALAADTKDE